MISNKRWRQEDKKASSSSPSKRKSGRRSRQHRKRVAQEDDEERRLTSLLFGDTSHSQEHTILASLDDTVDHQRRIASNTFDIAIDRTGVDAEDLPDDTNDEQKNDVAEYQKDDLDVFTEAGFEDGEQPVWQDEDDEKIQVDLLQTNRLRKLRTFREEPTANALAGVDFAHRLRDRYISTAQRTARTDWAESSGMKEGKSSETNLEDKSLDITDGSSFLRVSSRRLPPGILNVVRCPDANQSDPNNAVVQSVHFHPGSEPDRPLMLTAGLDKTLRFFQVGAEESVRVHGIHFPKLPIYSAQFIGKSGNVLISGRRPFFYIYDAIAGKLDLIPRILGRAEKSWERSVASPDGRTVAFCGNDGYVILFDTVSKRAKAELKLNGSVRALTFSPDGEHILASGSDGDVYRWDVRSKKCLERFANEDGTITSSLALSSSKLAVGAESGVVNLFSGALGKEKKPVKSIMNLSTSNDALRFSNDGQILAFSSRREKDSLKLLHVPTATVFSNWPTSKTPLGYVWSVDFSPASKFIAIGNDKGKCLLYSLEHYASSD